MRQKSIVLATLTTCATVIIALSVGTLLTDVALASTCSLTCDDGLIQSHSCAGNDCHCECQSSHFHGDPKAHCWCTSEFPQPPSEPFEPDSGGGDN